MSKASLRFSQDDLIELLKQSRRRNQPIAITGLLLYCNGNFMQLLEGAREKVGELMVRIKKDTRHHDVVVLGEGPIDQRTFSHWSMAFLDFHAPQVRALPGYSTFLEDPFSKQDVAGMLQRKVRLLHYFRAVMTASDASTLRLAATADLRAADSTPDPRRT